MFPCSHPSQLRLLLLTTIAQSTSGLNNGDNGWVLHPSWLFNCRSKQDLWPGGTTVGPGGRAADTAGSSWLEVGRTGGRGGRRCRLEQQLDVAVKVKQQLGTQHTPQEKKEKVDVLYYRHPSSPSAARHFRTLTPGGRGSEARRAGGRKRGGRSHLSLLLLPGRIQEEVPVPVVLLLHVHFISVILLHIVSFLCAGGAGRVCFAPRRGDVSQRRIGSVYSPPRIQHSECVYGGN